jgi:hypothetical protein
MKHPIKMREGLSTLPYKCNCEFNGNFSLLLRFLLLVFVGAPTSLVML